MDHNVEKEHPNHNPSRELQIVNISPQFVNTSPFGLPDGWLVEERRRPSKPSHIDRYFYEPITGRKFRSLLAVQRHLAQESGDHLITGRMTSKNENTTYIESGAVPLLLSSSAVDNFLEGQKASTATPKEQKSVVKSGARKQKTRSVRSFQKPVNQSLVAVDEIPPEASKRSIHSMNSDSQRKINSAKDNGAPKHNLPSPPPDKVSWVLTGPGFWTPFVDGSAVLESEKLKWSEAFVLSTQDGATDTTSM